MTALPIDAREYQATLCEIRSEHIRGRFAQAETLAGQGFRLIEQAQLAVDPGHLGEQARTRQWLVGQGGPQLLTGMVQEFARTEFAGPSPVIASVRIRGPKQAAEEIHHLFGLRAGAFGMLGLQARRVAFGGNAHRVGHAETDQKQHHGNTEHACKLVPRRKAEHAIQVA